MLELAPDAALAAGDRTISYIFSDESVARDGNTIATSGWRLDNFLANPVFLWAHDADAPPIGKVTFIRAVGSELRGAVRYATAEEYPFADTIFRLTKGGFINATSVSWLPIEWRRATDPNRPGGIDFLDQELLEVSGVPLPSLPTALATARGAGIDVAPVAAWAERALDLGQAPINRKELEMVRALTALSPRKVYYATRPNSAVRSESRSAAAVVALPSRGPFRSFGEFLQAVAFSELRGGRPDPRLTRALPLERAPTGLGEADPTAGGFTVPDVFSEELIGSMYEEAVLAPLCDRRETDKPNNATLPAIDETSRADGSRWGGVVSYWDAEGVEPPATLPKFKALKFSARKLIALCVASDELINDVPLLDGHMRRAFAAEGAFQLDKAILLGTGAGVPLGIVNAPGTIQVAGDIGQASATITAGNIANMWSRAPAPCRKRAVWIVNEDAEGQLDALSSADFDSQRCRGLFPGRRRRQRIRADQRAARHRRRAMPGARHARRHRARRSQPIYHHRRRPAVSAESGRRFSQLPGRLQVRSARRRHAGMVDADRALQRNIDAVALRHAGGAVRQFALFAGVQRPATAALQSTAGHRLAERWPCGARCATRASGPAAASFSERAAAGPVHSAARMGGAKR